MKKLLFIFAVLVSVAAGAASGVVQDTCGPFTDVSPALCPYVLKMYYLGITAGTSPTTYSPDSVMTRGQAAVFVSKGVNQAMARSSRRAALGQWWTTRPWIWQAGLAATPLPGSSWFKSPVVADGADVWVAGSGGISRVRASDGKLLETWPTSHAPVSLLAAMGRIFVSEFDSFGTDSITMIEPALPPGTATAVVTGLTTRGPALLAFDGARIFRSDGGESVSVVTPAATTPWPVTTVSGFQNADAMVFDGRHMWLYDVGACTLLRLDSAAVVLQTVSLPGGCTDAPLVFDGSNVIVPTNGELRAVRASDGSLVGEVAFGVTPNGLAFDGERILVLLDGFFQAPDQIALVRASDLTILRTEIYNSGFGEIFLESAASDGLNFWISASTNTGLSLARF